MTSRTLGTWLALEFFCLVCIVAAVVVLFGFPNHWVGVLIAGWFGFVGVFGMIKVGGPQ